ncbi:helix-turn-helix domain-containing protein [Paenibacillus sp. FSL R10-2199]|uniref:helix-turn-helix domain-containing protein n=1 Tax=Paenibacillus sp. FSL R10-2199 TaxID=2975348 RepID=UPI0030F5F5AB
MREYDLLRIHLLKTLVQMEEQLLVSVGKEKFQSNTSADCSDGNSTLQQAEPQMKAVFSVSELSDYLGVSTDCIYTMVRENQIPFVRVRRRILFYKDSINSWIHTNTPYP